MLQFPGVSEPAITRVLQPISSHADFTAPASGYGYLFIVPTYSVGSAWKDSIVSWQRMTQRRPKRLVCVMDDEREHDAICAAAGNAVPVMRASDEWEMAPESYQIITGDAATLLSGALNRGYGLQASQWPIRFGLLNIDALWCGRKLPAQAELASMRRRRGAGSHGTAGTIISVDALFDTNGDCSDVEDIVGEPPPKAVRPMNKQHGRDELWVPLADHLSGTVNTMRSMCSGLRCSLEPDLITAARYHDWAKAHPRFKDAFLADLEPRGRAMRGKTAWARRRPRVKTDAGFFHDLVGGCAMIGCGMHRLPSYLVLSHHGRFRTSIPDVSDELPATDLGGGALMGGVRINVTSDTHRKMFLRLYRDHGPFVLAYLEALLRVADIRTSRSEAGEGGQRSGSAP